VGFDRPYLSWQVMVPNLVETGALDWIVEEAQRKKARKKASLLWIH
jgi:hypothetical protein